MNPIVLNEEQTRTIKYLNKGHQPQPLRRFSQDQSSEQTEKQYNQEMIGSKKKKNIKNNNQNTVNESKNHQNRIVVIESLDQFGNQREISKVLTNLTKPKHKKGKSMDMQQLQALSKDEKGYFIQSNSSGENRGKIIINSQFLNDFRDRGSISQMKQYNFSKKLGMNKKIKDESISNNKKKKAKSINEGDCRIIKKQMKPIYDITPLQFNFKKKDFIHKSSRTSRSNSNNPFGKSNKNGCKSHQISTTQRKSKSINLKQKSKIGLIQIKNIAYTMPITSKMVSLYSNTSSLFNSKSSLQQIKKPQSYVIPTEQSIQQISQIRRYESLSLRRRSSENIRKVSLINELQQEDNEHKQSTQHIISQYLHLLNTNELQFQRNGLSNDLQLSQIPHQNSIKERNEEIQSQIMLGSLNLGDIHDISQSNQVIVDKSVVVDVVSQQVSQQQQQIQKLNEIIEIIKKKQRSQSLSNEQIILQIKNLINKTNQQKQDNKQLSQIHEEHIDQQQKKQNSKKDLSESELKDSLYLQQNMQGLKLEMLDKTLRQRQRYLIDRKQKQLERLQQSRWKDPDLQKQRQKIEKWMNHQIKQVVHIRKQLWKGFNIAKNLLVSDNPVKEGKKNQMIKCLSDKYLARSYKINKKQASPTLSRGRVNQVQSSQDHKDSQHSSELNIDLKVGSEDDEDEQLLDSSAKLQNQFEVYKKKLMQNEGRVQFQQHSSEQTQVKIKQSKLLQPPAIGVLPSVGGLSLQRIQCEIDYEDSFTSQQMQVLAKQSEKVKNESMKIPYELSIEDKQDIYEFIFLDLCIQLTDEYPGDSILMRKINNFIKNMKQQSKKQKGFKTNTNAIRDYLFQFITYLKNKTQQLQIVHINIDKPLGPTAIDILKYMHVYDDDPIDEENNQTVFILDIKLFQGFQQIFLNNLEFQKYYEDQEKQKKRKTFLKNAIHIHNKAIFDALNETLDRQRPYGVWGEPFSWKKTAKFFHPRDTPAKNSLILRSAQKTIEFGAYMCGFIVDKEDCNLKNNPNVTQAYIDQIRDDRLSRLLANELQESEEKMLFIDDEQTQILVEVGQNIIQNLFAEFCRQLAKLK